MGTYVFRDFTQIPKETALQLIVSLDTGQINVSSFREE